MQEYTINYSIEMNLEMLASMKIGELKGFLRLRGLKSTGRKQELVARYFVAQENDTQIFKTAEEVQREIAERFEK